MTGSDVAAACLLTLAALGALVSLVGVWAAPNGWARLHYLGPASVVTAPLVALAVVATEAFDTRGLKSLLVALVLGAGNALLVHQTARVMRVRQRQRAQ
ncbi:MAG TPA: monovalent cation/H(+) antiporter subunit G [Acidimicrobiia bacterium]